MHDCYARIGILYFFSHWMTSVSLYSQCHCFGELHGLWPAWSVTFHHGSLVPAEAGHPRGAKQQYRGLDSLYY